MSTWPGLRVGLVHGVRPTPLRSPRKIASIAAADRDDLDRPDHRGRVDDVGVHELSVLQDPAAGRRRSRRRGTGVITKRRGSRAVSSAEYDAAGCGGITRSSSAGLTVGSHVST
jgi:hypothetical protein